MPKHPLLLQTQYYTYTVVFILLSSKAISLCSCCAKKGLVYIAIAALFGHQPSSYAECTRLNIRTSYDVCSVSDAKYIYTRLLSL